mgnify:CR=1 FL=1
MTVLLYKEHVRGISIFFQQGTAYKHNRFTNHELVQSNLNGKNMKEKGLVTSFHNIIIIILIIIIIICVPNEVLR